MVQMMGYKLAEGGFELQVFVDGERTVCRCDATGHPIGQPQVQIARLEQPKGSTPLPVSKLPAALVRGACLILGDKVIPTQVTMLLAILTKLELLESEAQASAAQAKAAHKDGEEWTVHKGEECWCDFGSCQQSATFLRDRYHKGEHKSRQHYCLTHALDNGFAGSTNEAV